MASAENPYKRVQWSKGGPLPCAATDGCDGFLSYMDPMDARRSKGVIMLFCPVCTVKQWGEAADLELRAKMLKQQARQAAREATE